jgi:class 3 adenylate cyclase/CHASE2 domain-containing sensor protein
MQPRTYEMAYVLSMDIVSYSLRSIDEQTELLTVLQKTVRESTEYEHALAAHELISLPTGDGMALVFFRDPVSPVKCALEVTSSLRRHSEIGLRMGIHTGPVCRHADIKEEVNVVGGGINMAQRVMDCGDSGHILLSRTVVEVLEQLRGWSDCLQDLGIHEVKHGVEVHLYNLCKHGLGNPAFPRRIKSVLAALPASLESPTASHHLAPGSRSIAESPRRLRSKQVCLFVLRGLLLIFVALLMHAGLMRSWVGRHLKNLEYTMLQDSLITHYLSTKPNDSVPLPVIIDISKRMPGLPDRPTNLEELDRIIKALAAMSPKAIGVDIDFSPGNTLIRPTDWHIFSQWRQLTRPEDFKPISVKLGVFRRLYDASKNWLGRPEFWSLAAGIAMPGDSQTNYYYVQAGSNQGDRLLQMAAALFEATGGKEPLTGGVLPRLYSEITSNRKHGVYVVDYSYLQELLDHQVVRYDDTQLLKAFEDKIKDNVVLIGDVAYGEDKFALAHTIQPISGILIHACSLMTLRKGPLRYVDQRGSIILDLILSLTSLLIVAVLPFIIHAKNTEIEPSVQANKKICLAVAILIFWVCDLWIGAAKVFWPDFLWISIGLFLNPFLADPLWRVLESGFHTATSVCRGILKLGYTHVP